jgi:polysaccharide biosynthesis protein
MTASNKRIAQNTLMLYFRQLFILLVNLYTVRVLLNVLGVEDYGTYNVVAGIVALFSFLSNTMMSATQRFFSFALGRNDDALLRKIFSINLLVYLLIALAAVVLLETLGLWFVMRKLNIPPGSLTEVYWLYHFSVLTFLGMICTSPFAAIIVAHEDMHIYAGISIIETFLKLIVVFLLICTKDKLAAYGAMLFAVSFLNAMMYLFVCLRKYQECTFRHLHFDKTLLREIFDFTGWTLFGQLSTVARNQAVTILLNQFFSPVVVAARAIALNVSGAINIFASNFNVGLYPPIIKEYAAGNRKEMFQLIFNGSKITFFLMWIIALPLFLEMDFILTLWLKRPPEGLVLFTRLTLIEALINSSSLPLITAARAPGKMKTYELTLGIIQLLIFPVSWLILSCGGQAYTVFIVAIIANLIMFAVRLFIVHILIRLPLKRFSIHVLLPLSAIMLCSALPSYLLSSFLPTGFLSTCILGLSTLLFSFFCMYFIGLTNTQRSHIQSIIIKRTFG